MSTPVACPDQPDPPSPMVRAQPTHGTWVRLVHGGSHSSFLLGLLRVSFMRDFAVLRSEAAVRGPMVQCIKPASREHCCRYYEALARLSRSALRVFVMLDHLRAGGEGDILAGSSEHRRSVASSCRTQHGAPRTAVDKADASLRFATLRDFGFISRDDTCYQSCRFAWHMPIILHSSHAQAVSTCRSRQARCRLRLCLARRRCRRRIAMLDRPRRHQPVRRPPHSRTGCHPRPQ